MKIKNLLKLLSVFIIFIACLTIQVEAELKTASGFTQNTYTSFGNAGSAATATNNIVGTVIQVIRVVGTGTSIIMLTYVAIKYMSAAPQEKAEFKKSATAYVVGAIIIFGASQILGIINTFASNNVS